VCAPQRREAGNAICVFLKKVPLTGRFERFVLWLGPGASGSLHMPVSGREWQISCGEPLSARSGHIKTVSKYPCGDGVKGAMYRIGNLCSDAQSTAPPRFPRHPLRRSKRGIAAEGQLLRCGDNAPRVSRFANVRKAGLARTPAGHCSYGPLSMGKFPGSIEVGSKREAQRGS
jgi:hypothetical protein